MAKRIKHYTKDFKISACKMVVEDGLNAVLVAQKLNLGVPMFYRWVREYEVLGDASFVGKGHARAEDVKYAKLAKENELLRQEVEILKKAAAYFTKQNGNA